MSDRRLVWVLAVVSVGPLAMGTASAAEWSWSLTPYAWLADVGLDVEINDREFLDTEVDVGDLIDDADFVGEAHFEGQRGSLGFFLDVSYWDFGDEDKIVELPGPLGLQLVAKGDLEQTLIEAGGLWNPSGSGQGLTLLYGARLLDIDEEIDARIEPFEDLTRRFETSQTFVDGLVGVRYVGSLTDRLDYALRADASAGGTDLTWNALAGLGYSFGASGNTLWLGYRHMEVEVEAERRGAELDTELTTSGPITGFTFRF